MTTTDSLRVRILLHAPTAGSLQRARKNAANILHDEPTAEVKIVLNAEAVAVALDQPNVEMDKLTWVCPNTLRNLSREPSLEMSVLPQAAALALGLLQTQGWTYVRA